MKRLTSATILIGFLQVLGGCAVYVPPYDNVGISYSYSPYYYGYGHYYGYRPHYFGGWRGYGWRGYGWRGRHWH